MIITEKAPGRHLQFGVDGTTIIFEKGPCIDLAKFAEVYDTVVDVCMNEDGSLTVGIGDYYAAQIHIPSSKRQIHVGEPDDFGFCVLTDKGMEVDMEKVVIELWPLIV